MHYSSQHNVVQILVWVLSDQIKIVLLPVLTSILHILHMALFLSSFSLYSWFLHPKCNQTSAFRLGCAFSGAALSIFFDSVEVHSSLTWPELAVWKTKGWPRKINWVKGLELLTSMGKGHIFKYWPQDFTNQYGIIQKAINLNQKITFYF